MTRDIMLRRHELFPGQNTPALTLPGVCRPSRLDHPGLALLVGAAATATLMLLYVIDAFGQRQAFESTYILVAAGSAAFAVGLLARRPGVTILRYGPLTLALCLTGAAMIAVDLGQIVGAGPSTVIANALFVTSAIPGMAVIVPSLYGRLDQRALATAKVDGAIMLLAGITLLLSVWHADSGSPDLEAVLMPVASAALFASGGMAAIVAFELRAAPTLRGVWPGIAGIFILGLGWLIWADRSLHGQAFDSTSSFLFAVGILILAYAWMTWNRETGGGRQYDGMAHLMVDWLPISGIVVCVALAAIPHGRVSSVDPVPIGTAAVVVLTVVRQRRLVASERLASKRLTSEIEERSQTMLSLARLEQGENVEQTADRICDEALRLAGIEAAGVYVFGPSGGAMAMAIGGRIRSDEMAGKPIVDSRAMHMRACASAGAWIDWPGDAGRDSMGSLLAEAFAPMRWDDRIVGVVSMGTTNREDARRLADRLPTLSEFGVVSTALLGPMLAAHWRLADIRSQLDRIIVTRAFHPVFQPVVRLQTRDIVGYEALTRFHDGVRPDRRFVEAHSAGMSVRLEMACLGEQLEAASWLPPGPWLSLNVSPALASAVVPLISALEHADRDLVLEITEHVEIADYQTLVQALNLVRGNARLAVDDAGAGYAGLRHILELSPQFVKLDISLVRHVDTDAARQAMVAGMAHFARNAGSELIAEGIETEEELAVLIRLGVSLGQGYLLGRPAPVA